MQNLLSFALCALFGYFLGNIQTGLLIGRLMNNIDLRKHGSGSSGATNALRVLGRQQALFTLLGDCLKGVAAVFIGLAIAGFSGGMVAGVAVVMGHIWPVFFSFRGGKGVATSLGVLITLTPLYSLIMIAIGLVALFLFKTVSIASITGACTYLVVALIAAIPKGDWFYLGFAAIIAALVIYAHRENIGRIRKGTENKLSASMFHKKK